jgi:hypothetical protein
MNKNTPAALALLLLLSACGPIMMQNPRTGQITECSSTNMYGQKFPDEQCAKALETAGWKRLTPDEPNQ